MSKNKSTPSFRSAVSGQFVTEKYANSHKATTVKETPSKPTPPKKGK
jgi:hypothetical protein